MNDEQKLLRLRFVSAELSAKRPLATGKVRTQIQWRISQLATDDSRCSSRWNVGTILSGKTWVATTTPVAPLAGAVLAPLALGALASNFQREQGDGVVAFAVQIALTLVVATVLFALPLASVAKRETSKSLGAGSLLLGLMAISLMWWLVSSQSDAEFYAMLALAALLIGNLLVTLLLPGDRPQRDKTPAEAPPPPR